MLLYGRSISEAESDAIYDRLESYVAWLNWV